VSNHSCKGLREKCHARLKEIEQGRFDAMKRKEKELAEKKKEGFTNDISLQKNC
jgi:hypothetical protein